MNNQAKVTDVGVKKPVPPEDRRSPVKRPSHHRHEELSDDYPQWLDQRVFDQQRSEG
jgi:hypothetical protein